MELLQTIFDEAKARGFVDAGAAPVEGAQLPGALSFVYRLQDAVIDTINHTAPTKIYYHHYRTVNFCLDQLALWAAAKLQQAGYRAIPIPASQTEYENEKAGLFSHKQAAVAAGLGSIGKSNLFLHRAYGPRVRLVTILTDYPIREKPEILPPPCGSCTLCRDHCPARAIEGKIWTPGTTRAEMLDAYACSQWMHDAYRHIGRGSVCGICMEICPQGLKHRK